MISDTEQMGYDFDWFFTNGEHIGHVASGGGPLPASVAMSAENLAKLWDYFSGLFYRCAVNVNPELKTIENLKTNPDVTDPSISSFTGMASRGLFSFDKTTVNNFNNPYYHLVASPVEPSTIAELPAEIRDILSATKYDGEISRFGNVGEVGLS
ncbi:hypothetical protein ACFGVS_14380 [Mucilaginibacter sp. AW1-7]|uniref:hypothetical protein n=1 Tax=Mucilaginibacter sp. AW1-7 TaxID=3349874 RepID=UPI003F7374B6